MIASRHLDSSWALEIGRAAEHFVVFDLVSRGIRAFLTEQGLPYDIVADVSGKLYRVQVKSAFRAKNVLSKNRGIKEAYCWQVRKRGREGKGDRLSLEHCDLVALVAIDIRRVAYVPVTACGQTVTLAADYAPGSIGFTIGELSDFHKAAVGHPPSLSLHGRRAYIRRNGQLTLVSAGADRA